MHLKHNYDKDRQSKDEIWSETTVKILQERKSTSKNNKPTILTILVIARKTDKLEIAEGKRWRGRSLTRWIGP